MSTPLDNLKEFLSGLDEEFDARVAAIADEIEAAGTTVEWQPDPDPFGLDWEWLFPPQTEESTPPERTQATTNIPIVPQRRRWSPAIGAATIAASLLVGLIAGWLAFGGDSAEQLQLLAANASVTFGPPRGGQPPPSVSVSAPFSGFATVFGLAPDRKQQIIPVLGGADIPVPQDDSSAPIPLRDDTTQVVFVVTPTPAAEALRNALDAPTARTYAPSDDEELIEHIQEILENKGHRRIAVGTVPVDPPE